MNIKWPAKPGMAIDLGNRTIKALKLKKKNGKVSLEKHLFHDLALSNPKFPALSGLDETLKGLIEVAGLKNLPVASCVDDSEVSTFDITLPDMPAKDLAEAIVSQVEPRVNFPIEEASLDHVVVSRSKVDGEDMVALKVYCARKNDLRGFVDLLTNATLKPSSIDVAMLANIEMLAFNEYLEEGKFSVVLDLGETKTNAALVNSKKLVLTNTIPIALGAINRRLHESTGVNYLEAERIKVLSSQRNEETDSLAHNLVDAVYLELFQQLQRSIEFFRVQTGGQPLAKILVIGGGAQFTAICTSIQATFGIDTVVVNPFRNIEIFGKGVSNSDEVGKIASHMGTVVGLALRGLNVA